MCILGVQCLFSLSPIHQLGEIMVHLLNVLAAEPGRHLLIVNEPAHRGFCFVELLPLLQSLAEDDTLSSFSQGDVLWLLTRNSTQALAFAHSPQHMGLGQQQWQHAMGSSSSLFNAGGCPHVGDVFLTFSTLPGGLTVATNMNLTHHHPRQATGGECSSLRGPCSALPAS